jgi:hypothetical protein
MAEPLDIGELTHLVERLEQAVTETGKRFLTQMYLVTGLFLLMAVGITAQGTWQVGIFVAAFGAFIAWVGHKASKKNSPERMRPIVDVVRNTPEAITMVRHYETSDSMRMFVNHWLSIGDGKHQLLLKAPDWQKLHDYLQRHCPNAKFTS